MTIRTELTDEWREVIEALPDRQTYAIDAPTIAEVCGLKAGDMAVKVSTR
jgi:hypothetical protein